MSTINSNSTTITIDGAYKDFVGNSGSTTTVIKRKSGDAIASGDSGRFLLWKATVGDTKTWEIRYIESATTTTITVGDGGFKSAPPEDAVFAISTNLEDIETAQSTACTSSGKNFSFNSRQWDIKGGAFLADINKSLEMGTNGGGNFPTRYSLGASCAIQFGRLLGGEANGSFETTQGCRIRFRNGGGNMAIFSEDYTSSQPTHPVANFYGCLIESEGDEMFMRAGGPLRIIGCVVDGTMGGRWLSEATELVQSRFSGNRNGVVSWSLGNTFTRPIESCSFYDNLYACKAYKSYSGEFRDTTFTDTNTDIIHSSGSMHPAGTFKFIDCTTFGADKIPHSRLNVEQLKSINYSVTDSSGTGLDDVLVGVYDKDNTLQTGVQTSVSGVVGQILAKFFIRPHKVSSTLPVQDKTPFNIRIRKYGYTYLGFQSAVSEPIKQEVRLVVDDELASTETEAQAITGINLNFSTKTLTITEDSNAQDLYDYYKYQLAQSGNMQYADSFTKTGTAFDLDDWDLVVDGCVYTGNIITSETITTQNSGSIEGTATDKDGTTIILPWSVSNVEATATVQLYNMTKSLEVVNQVAGGTLDTKVSESGTYSSSQIEAGDNIRLRITCQAGASAFLPYEAYSVASASGIAFIADQEADEVYNTNGIDGSTVTTLSADYPNVQIDISDGDGVADSRELYAFAVYQSTTTTGIQQWFNAITAIDAMNYRINTGNADIKLQNTGNTPLVIKGARIYRDDGTSVLFAQSGDQPMVQDTGELVQYISPQVDTAINNNTKLDGISKNTKLIATTL